MFTGPFQAQIDSLAARVATLEKDKTPIDSIDSLGSIPAQTGLVGGIYRPSARSLAGSETFRNVQKGVSDQCVGTPFTPPMDTIKKSRPEYRVVFHDSAKANTTVDADRFVFEAGFIVFSRTDAAPTSVAAYPAREISSITKL